jgi:vacuolar-type H+-ATPase subunit H
MQATKEAIKAQEEFVKAISYQKEAAENAYWDAKQYAERIIDKYIEELHHLHKMKESNV